MSEAEIVETESGREVRMSYRRGCHGYTTGFASAFMWAAVVCGYGILWQQHLPERVYHTLTVGFVGFSLAGFAIVQLAYMKPVWFYELLEGAHQEDGSHVEEGDG
jgi:hypothetical protein